MAKGYFDLLPDGRAFNYSAARINDSQEYLPSTNWQPGYYFNYATQTWVDYNPAIINPQPIEFMDTANFDAFSRLRVSEPVTLFDSTFEYPTSTVTAKWRRLSLGGTGTSTNLPNESSIQLTTGGVGNGSGYSIYSNDRIRYQPGKSNLVLMTFAMDESAATNTVKRLGQYDAQNGFYFEKTVDNAGIVSLQFGRRTYTSGVAVDNLYYQADWNIDPLDGSGPSGMILDPDKTNILVIDYQWLGVGRIRFGFDIDGQIVYAHQVFNASVLSEVYMTAPNLPLRYEVYNSAVSSGTATMKCICQSVISEGGFETGRGYQHSASSGPGWFSTSSAAWFPVISVRAAASLDGKTFKGFLMPKSVDIFVNANQLEYVIGIVTVSMLSGAAFGPVYGTAGAAEYDVAATSYLGTPTLGAATGWTFLDRGFSGAGSGSKGVAIGDLIRDIQLAYPETGAVGDWRALTVAVRRVGASNPDLGVGVTWLEFW